MQILRHTLTSLVIGLFTLLTATDALGQEEFSSLEERMTGEEFDRAGLGKLTPQELRHLNEWLRARSVAEYERPAGDSASAGATASADQRGLTSTETRSEIRTRIQGTFNGWDGPTRYEMANGMVWETVGSGSYQVPDVENPPVVISPRIFSGWEMRVGDYNRRVQVQRIE